MLEVLSIVIKLQVIDNKLMDIEEEKGDLPEQLEKLQNEVDARQTVVKSLETQLNQYIAERAHNSEELNKAEERHKRSQAVLFSVKTTREYDAITQEIEQSRQTMTTAGQNEINLKNQIENLEIELNQKKIELQEVKKEFSARKKEMDQKLDATKDESDALNAERSSYTSKLKRPVLDHYERIRKIRDGIGVSYLVGDACSYCYSVLPPQRKAEIRKMEDMFLCEVCGCIMVSEEYGAQLASVL